MLMTVAAVQSQVGRQLTLEEKILIFKRRPDFVCLPEYFLLDSSMADYHRAALHWAEHLDYIHRLSDELSTCLIGGTIVEPFEDKIYNTAYLFDRGERRGSYRKRFPVPGEAANGIASGSEPLVFEVEGVRIGVAICGDVFYPHQFEEMRAQEVDIIFVPTTSRFRSDDTVMQKRQRDQLYFIDNAALAGAFVVKTCSVGSIFGHPLQGRSSISAPWGMITQVDYRAEQMPRILSATLDIAELREFRRKFALAVKAEMVLSDQETHLI